MRLAIPLAATLCALAACGGDAAKVSDSTAVTDSAMAPSAASAATAVTAMVMDASGNALGTLTLADSASGISISGMLHGLPDGEHGIHIHAIGKCEAPAFTSAGGHWNPATHKHGTDNPEGPHFGDMMNITVTGGMATVQLMTQGGTLHGENALLDADGAAIVVHAGPDDYKTDPSGNSGDRVACGTIGSM